VTKASPTNGAFPDVLDVDLAWSLLLSLAHEAREGRALTTATGYALVRDRFRRVPLEEALCIIDPRARPGRQIEVRRHLAVQSGVRALFELYLPLLIGARAGELAVGHMGSDGEESRAPLDEPTTQVTEGMMHLHRMRALFDAVIVGVRTILWDDPLLSTRLVVGPHPTRVVLDPHGRLERPRRVLTESVAPTIVCVDPALLPQREARGHVDYLGVPTGPSGFDARALFHELRTRFGLRRFFVEGGGTTVSRLLSAGLLDRVQVSVAPMVMGSGPMLRMSPLAALKQSLAPSCRHIRLGAEAFFDLDLLAEPGGCPA
jgi:diaminohydroxyphosphoribosylaminopyrimidine deaminase/5-amino-6-(5-phosphoribosylamino)uracil reductase